MSQVASLAVARLRARYWATTDPMVRESLAAQLAELGSDPGPGPVARPARPAATPAVDFSDAQARNAANAERLRKERLAANKSVLRSYRIKS